MGSPEGDVKDFFYRLEICDALTDYCCLEKNPAKDLLRLLGEGAPGVVVDAAASRGEDLWPAICMLPIGLLGFSIKGRTVVLQRGLWVHPSMSSSIVVLHRLLRLPALPCCCVLIMLITWADRLVRLTSSG